LHDRPDLAPLELAGRLALALGLAAFIGLAFEEVYKREERSAPGGVRTFPMLALSGAMLYLIEPHQALAFVVGLIALAVWLHASLHNAPYGPNTETPANCGLFVRKRETSVRIGLRGGGCSLVRTDLSIPNCLITGKIQGISRNLG
jgi:hypothetical protein